MNLAYERRLQSTGNRVLGSQQTWCQGTQGRETSQQIILNKSQDRRGEVSWVIGSELGKGSRAQVWLGVAGDRQGWLEKQALQ